MRIGIFGGTFDPIHTGHLLLADTAADELELDEVRFTPAAQSPLKPRPPAEAKHRLEMVRLATGGDRRFRVDDQELRREGVSYTIDTLRAVRAQEPQADLFLLIGADSLSDFALWREPAAILELATLATAYRGGLEPPDFAAIEPFASAERIERCRAAVLRMPQIEISSSDIRNRIAAGRSIRYRIPAAVAAYLDAQRLYRD